MVLFPRYGVQTLFKIVVVAEDQLPRNLPVIAVPLACRQVLNRYPGFLLDLCECQFGRVHAEDEPVLGHLRALWCQRVFRGISV